MRDELEAAIEDNPYDARAYAVLGDHLQEIGDPRGQLIALQLASRSGAMTHTASQYFEAHPEFHPPDGVEFGWACGYARAATIENAKAFVVRQALSHASARFLAELRIRGNNLSSSIAAIAELAPRSLRVLQIHDDTSVVSLAPLWPAASRLVELDVRAHGVELGAMQALEVARLRVWPASLEALKTICGARLPKLTWLSIRKGKRERRDDIEALLRRVFPHLGHLEIVN